MDRTERTSGTTYYRLTAAAHLVGMPPSRVRRYVEVGLVRTVVDERGSPVLGAAELARLRKIRRLTNDLGLNVPGVEVALRLLDEIDALRAGLARPDSPDDAPLPRRSGVHDRTGEGRGAVDPALPVPGSHG